KAFLSHFLEGLRTDLQETGVFVTDVRPGFIRTAMTEGSKLAMPFMIDLDRAADTIAASIAAKESVVAFPWQLATLVRAGMLLPARYYDRAVRRVRKT
ncbi:MAG TPA: hypothetical protein VJT73_19905, partial [Polyangiaceae bacterium]|nr:hypothetical protein [Polyangiaceae bacterium]